MSAPNEKTRAASTVRGFSSSLYLNDHQAAEYTGLSVATLRRDRFQKRGFPYVKFGRSVRYRREDIDREMSLHLIVPKSA